MRALTAILTLSSLASPTLAREPILSLPIDCNLGDTCYIQNFVDTDPSGGAADFTCGALSYDGHKGTDFALPTVNEIDRGVKVLAAAPGTVIATRDGMADHLQNTEDAPDVTGKECGNGVVIRHGDGWSSQYCHMQNGSISVQKGQRVGKGTPLGNVGLSGMTEFAHVHFVVRKDGEVVDPFNPSGIISCTQTSTRTLWQDPMYYSPTGLLSVGISNALPQYRDVKSGSAQVATLPANSSALVAYGLAYGSQTGDLMTFDLTGPTGLVFSHEVAVEKPQAQYFRAVGEKTSEPWATGIYEATVQILRDGTTVSQMTHEITITP